MARLADVVHMNVGCVEEPLSSAQKVWQARLKREHAAALNEVEQLQKEANATKRLTSYMVEVKTKQLVKAKRTATSENRGDENQTQERAGLTSALRKIAPAQASTTPAVTPQPPAPIALAPANLARVLMVTNNITATSTVASTVSISTPTVVSIPAVSVTSRPSVSPAETSVNVTPNQRVTGPLDAVDKAQAALLVTVTPSKMLQPQALAKKREELDAFVKSKLVMTPRLFVEWLLQVGLLKSAQSAICESHPTPTKLPLHLAISCEENRFPNSGGYVWISTCCGDTFVSVFQGSIFDKTSLSPHTILKLVYHWCCQTPLKNVLQWVNVEKAFLNEFYALLRAVCTVSLHSATAKFGSSTSSYVEIGVISLGTTSADGKKRDVKVEVLGIYDRDSRKMILKASEPIAETGTARRRLRFARIFQNLPKWVSTDAILLTDTTVDTSVLNDLGFRIVIQKSASSSNTQDQKFTNKTIMEYLRKTVPHAFINTLTILSLNTIQQFLDELVWRENFGYSSAGAFHSLLKDLATQTRAPGPDILTRLKKVVANPFEEWRVPDAKTQPTGVSLVARTPQPAAAKRPATSPSEAATPVKQSRVVTHFGTLPGTQKPNASSIVSLKCQYSDCGQLLSNNLNTMQHLRYHAARDAGVDAAVLKEQCRYCLADFGSAAERNNHVHTKHIFTENIMKSSDSYIENVVLKQETCVICTKTLSSRQRLDQHIRGCHVLAEMPYKCRVCNYRTSIHADLIQHFHEEHRRTAHLLCPICLDTYVITGENSTGLSSAHMQYLAHIRAHLMVPEDGKQQCKSCVLTFLQADQLTHHLKVDHASQSVNPEVRSFTYSYQNKTDAQGTPRAGTSAKGSQRAGPLSSKPGYRPPSKTRNRTRKKQGGKDPTDDTIVRRFTGLTLDPSISPELKCKECGEPMVKENHFVAYHCCPSCRFATCCRLAMVQHNENAHKPDRAQEAQRMGGSVYSLSSTIYCGCGFTSENAAAAESHLTDCSNGQLSFKEPST